MISSTVLSCAGEVWSDVLVKGWQLKNQALKWRNDISSIINRLHDFKYGVLSCAREVWGDFFA